jgi:hypothetical protein
MNAAHPVIFAPCHADCAVTMSLGLLFAEGTAFGSEPEIGLTIPAGSSATGRPDLSDRNRQT